MFFVQNYQADWKDSKNKVTQEQRDLQHILLSITNLNLTGSETYANASDEHKQEYIYNHKKWVTCIQIFLRDGWEVFQNSKSLKYLLDIADGDTDEDDVSADSDQSYELEASEDSEDSGLGDYFDEDATASSANTPQTSQIQRNLFDEPAKKKKKISKQAVENIPKRPRKKSPKKRNAKAKHVGRIPRKAKTRSPQSFKPRKRIKQPKSRKRPRPYTDSETESEQTSNPSFGIDTLRNIVSPVRSKSRAIVTQQDDEKLLTYLAHEAPPRAFTWDDLTPGTKAEGQRERTGLVNVMATKLQTKPFSYLTMKKHLRIVAKDMTVDELNTWPRSKWKGKFYVQSGGQHVRGLQQAIKSPETRAILCQDKFRPSYDLFGGKEMSMDLWQRLVTETQASEEVYSSWRLLEKIDIGRCYLKTWKILHSSVPLTPPQKRTISALFPNQKRSESIYCRVRMMR